MRFPLAILPVLLLAGCDDWLFTFETRIDPSARLTRETEIRHHGDSNGEQIASRFRLPASARLVHKDDGCARLEWSAAEPKDARPDFVLAVNAGRRDPHNAIEWAREDCVFFDRYVYREEFHDSVDEADRDAATERLFAFLRGIVVQALAMETDGRYGLAPLEAWLDGPARHLAFDVARILCTEKDSARAERRIAARLGADGIEVEEKNFEAPIERFLEKKLEELLVPREGAPRFDARPLFARDENGKRRLDKVLEDAAVIFHGSKEAADKAAEDAVRAVTGDMGNVDVAFRARVVMPGRVFRTNGAVEQADRDARVFWTFGSHDVAGTGHALECESIVMRPDVLARAPGGRADLGAPGVLAAIAAVAGLDADARARLRIAFLELDVATPDAAKDRLPEELRGPFEKLLEAAARGR